MPPHTDIPYVTFEMYWHIIRTHILNILLNFKFLENKYATDRLAGNLSTFFNRTLEQFDFIHFSFFRRFLILFKPCQEWVIYILPLFQNESRSKTYDMKMNFVNMKAMNL